MPEYQWALAEAWRELGRAEDAVELERELKRRGASADSRTLALFLATRGEDDQEAVRLAQAELNNRRDIFTHDAVAWTLAAAGRWDESRVHMRQALAEGTEDARLFLHAGVIASQAGDMAEAGRYLARASATRQTLLPSEKLLLEKHSRLSGAGPSPSRRTAAENSVPSFSVPEEGMLPMERSRENQNQKGRS